MDDRREATEDLLDDRPELASGLRTVLSVDAERETWGFEDVPLDSGAFGEVVSRGIVVDDGDGYRVADRDALAAALDVDPDDEEPSTVAMGGLGDWLSAALRSRVTGVDRRVATGLGLAVGLVVLFRVVPYGAVFRGEAVVLSANDPYFYRYVVEQMVAAADGPLDFGVLSDLPAGMGHGEPLLVATLWWVTELLGGGARTAGLVMAWYPVVSAAFTGLLLYALAARVTGDRRVGIAAVSLLAVTPLHAIRTGVGFADHHPFDYAWLVLTALALVALVDRSDRTNLADVDGPADRGGPGDRDADGPAGRTALLDRDGPGTTLRWTAVLGVAVAAQVLAWESGPLLLVPVALFVVLRTVSDLRAGASPLRAGLPVAAGVAVAAVLVQVAHVGLGWHAGVVAATPALLLVGIAGALVLAEGLQRVGGSPGQLVALQGVGALAAAVVVVGAYPSFASEAGRGLDRLFGTENVIEAAGLFGGHFEWVIGPLVFFGFALFLAVLYMAWAGWRTYREHDPPLLVAATYAWFFFGLTVLQIRFAGEFAPFAALFAGLGFVHVAAWVDLARVPAPFSRSDAGPRERGGAPDAELEWPERRTAAYTAGLWLGVGSLGAAMSAIKHAQVTTGDDEYEVAAWIAADAAERGLEYPANYVLTPWPVNRMYNYFVSGRSRGYGFARTNYDRFLRSRRPESWYRRLRGRVGYVVLTPESGVGGLLTADSTYYRLSQYGSRSDAAPGLGHYRARYVSDGGRTVFELVAGATIVGAAEANAVVTVAADVELEGDEFRYERRVRAGDGGTFRATVAYPGRYEVGDGRTVRVPESAVRNGETVRVDG